MSIRSNCAVASLAALAALSATSASADSFRCGAYVINEGMPTAELVAKCGEPQAKAVVEEPIMARRTNGTIYQAGVARIEHWTYERGPRELRVRVTVEKGEASRIEFLTRPG